MYRSKKNIFNLQTFYTGFAVANLKKKNKLKRYEKATIMNI